MSIRRALVALLLPVVAAGQEPSRVDAQGDALPPGAIARLGTGRWRPGGFVEYLSFSVDGKQLSSFHRGVSNSNEFIVWDAATGKELRRAQVHVLSGDAWQRLANGRSVALLSFGHGDVPMPMEVTPQPRPPFVPQRGTSYRTTNVWPPTGNDHRDNDPNGPMLMSPPGGAGGANGLDCLTTALTADGRYFARAPWPAKAGDPSHFEVWDLTTRSAQNALSPPRQFGSQPGRCTALRYAPGGRTLVAFSPQKPGPTGKPEELLAFVWDTATGKERRRFTIPAPRVTGSYQNGNDLAYQFANLITSDAFLVSYAERDDDVVRLFALDGKTDRQIKTGHRRTKPGAPAVTAIAFSPDGRTLLTGGHDGSVKLWDPGTGRELLHLPTASAARVLALAVDPAGKRLACGGTDGVIHLWDLATQREIAPGPFPRRAVVSVALSADASAAAALTVDGSLRFYDPVTGRERAAVAIPPVDPMAQLTRAPDGRIVIFAAGAKLHSWDLATGQERPALPLPAGPLAYSAHFADERTLILLRPGEVALCDWPSGKLRRTFTLPVPKGTKGEVRACVAALSPDGRRLATISGRHSQEVSEGWEYGHFADVTVELFNAATGVHEARLVQQVLTGFHLAFLPSGDLMLVCGGQLLSRDGAGPMELSQSAIHLVDPATGRLRRSITTPRGHFATMWSRWPGLGVTLSRDGRSLLFTGDDQGTIYVAELLTGQVRRELYGHRGVVGSLALTPDGRRLVSGSADLTGLVWDTSLGSAKPDERNSPDYLWSIVAEANANSSFEAMTQLAARPKAALELIRTGVRPVPNPPDTATLDRLVADLADARFAVRDRAHTELERYGESIVPALRARRAKLDSAEARKRVDALLARHDPDALTPARLREERALELLEALNTPDARALLAELAKGADARLTRSAAASLRRMEARAK